MPRRPPALWATSVPLRGFDRAEDAGAADRRAGGDGQRGAGDVERVAADVGAGGADIGVGQLHRRPAARNGDRLRIGAVVACTHSRFAASPSPLPVLARAATTQATRPTATTIRAPRGAPSGGRLSWGGVATARQYWNQARIRGAAIPRPPSWVRSLRGRQSDATEQGRAETAGGRGPRPADELHRSRLWAGSAADPRDGRDLRQLGIGDRAAGDQPHRDRPRLPGPRLLGAGRRRLLRWAPSPAASAT